jgi:uncharacterized protein YxjI
MQQNTTQWSGAPWQGDPDNYWVDDETGELVRASDGSRITVGEMAAVAKAKGH